MSLKLVTMLVVTETMSEPRVIVTVLGGRVWVTSVVWLIVEVTSRVMSLKLVTMLVATETMPDPSVIVIVLGGRVKVTSCGGSVSVMVIVCAGGAGGGGGHPEGVVIGVIVAEELEELHVSQPCHSVWPAGRASCQAADV